MARSLYKVGYRVHSTFHGSPGYGDDAAISESLDSIWGEDSAVNKWLQTKLFPFMDSNGNIDLTNPDSPITYDKDKQLVEFNPTFTTELNQQLQDSIHYLDGYVLYVPEHSLSEFPYSNIINYLNTKYTLPSNAEELLRAKMTPGTAYFTAYSFSTSYEEYSSNVPYVYDITDSKCYIVEDSGYWRVYVLDSSGNPIISPSSDLSYYTMRRIVWDASKNDFVYKTGSSTFSGNNPCYVVPSSLQYSYGAPIRVFYSLQDLKNFLNKGRIYVPKLPSGGFKVNIKYINNTTNLPDITYNITTENKTETEIQNQFDTTFNNYLNDLNDFTDGGGGTINPTPTPSGGGSGGDFGDGTTPTPKPDFTDGSLTDTNTLLQKILDKLTEFSANHDKLAKTITDYIEKNDGKLEEILIAIQALSDGKTETEQNGCKYDFTALSNYLTDLWNNSDKKFDEMVKLLEENNKYQQKLVDSLNEIKALLITDTVMDFFKDRSQETAEKAKDKFPTSIPWDVSLVLNSMSAEPKNPKFSLPIKIESFKINETIDIDLSTGEWEKLAKTCRYILSVTFILFLIHLSRKLFSNGGDD